MRRILFIYALSGFISLAYQVAWFRIVTDWFGSTNQTFALVVTNFIGGLAVGSLQSRRLTALLERSAWLGRGLRAYGMLELLVAASILLTVLAAWIPADLFGSFPYQERDGVWSLGLGYRAFQLLVAAASVFVPTFFMGATFPLLCDRFRTHPEGARFPAALYAWNTLGACSGVLACQFVLLPTLGHDATLRAMAVANAVLGVGVLAARSDFGSSSPELPASAPAAERRQASVESGALLVLVTLSGFLSGGLEGDLFKRITFVIELNPGATMSFISFWAILAIFLASAAVHRLRWIRLVHLKLGFALAALYCLAVWPHVDAIRDLVEAGVLPLPLDEQPTLEGFRSLQFPTSLTQLLVFCGILVFPPYLLVSLLLPWACNELQRDGRHLGRAYGLNTLAFCAGLLAFVLVAPRVNIFYSLELFPILLAIAAAWMFVVRETREPLALWKPTALLAGSLAAVGLVPADFDRDFFREGSPPAVHPVRAVKSNGAHTTFIVDVPGGPRLFFGRMLMSATNLRARTYMSMMAHFPLLLQEDPQKALLICLGVGNTGSAIASHPGIRQIDIVDLNHRIFETAPELAEVNRSLHLDPRVRFIHDDGRNFLNLTHERYDLITSEPPPPLAAGVYRLYSREYYESVLEHLTPRGAMTQWLPLFLMTPESVEMAVKTFADVFPHTLVYSGYGTDFLLMGSPSPIDLSVLERRFGASPEVAGELASFNIRAPHSLLARIVQSGDSLRRRYASASTISDQHNHLENLLLDPRARPVVEYDAHEVVAFVGRSAPESLPQVEGILEHLGRLRYHVQGYPFETLAAVDPERFPDVALADVDWMALAELYQENTAALRAGRADLSMRILERFLEHSEEQPDVLFVLALRHMAARRYDRALPLLEAFARLEPEDEMGRQALARARARERRASRSVASPGRSPIVESR